MKELGSQTVWNIWELMSGSDEKVGREGKRTKGKRVVRGLRKACTGTNKVLRMGVVPGRVWGSEALGMAPSQRENLRRQMASAAEPKPSMALSLLLEINNLEVEHELACVATCFWAQAVWTGQWEDDVREGWKKTGVGSYIVDESQRASRCSHR